jgi:hypothetical protein
MTLEYNKYYLPIEIIGFHLTPHLLITLTHIETQHKNIGAINNLHYINEQLILPPTKFIKAKIVA